MSSKNSETTISKIKRKMNTVMGLGSSPDPIFSPIFETPNKGKPKGVDALKEVVDEFGKSIKKVLKLLHLVEL